jgi:hypothetical protein
MEHSETKYVISYCGKAVTPWWKTGKQFAQTVFRFHRGCFYLFVIFAFSAFRP